MTGKVEDEQFSRRRVVVVILDIAVELVDGGRACSGGRAVVEAKVYIVACSREDIRHGNGVVVGIVQVCSPAVIGHAVYVGRTRGSDDGL